MSVLLGHAKAARILAESLANRAQQMGDPTGILTCLADAHCEAADRMEEEMRAGCTGEEGGLHPPPATGTRAGRGPRGRRG